MLITAKLPRQFWGLAAEYAPEIKTEAPHAANHDSMPPNRIWGEPIENTKMLLPFCCSSWIWRPTDTRQKKRLD
eukprot:620771-Rhodomonas_salina.1